MKNLKLYANCIPTKGFRRSVIIDLQFGEYVPIPNALFNLLKQYDGYKLSEIQKKNPIEYSETINEYYEYLKDKKYIFEVELGELDLFPHLSLEWDFPSIASNAIIEYNQLFFERVISQLEILQCKSLRIIFSKYSKKLVETILNKLNETSFTSFELQFNNTSKQISFEKDASLFMQYPRIQNVFFFNSKISKIFPLKTLNIHYLKNTYLNSQCGNISRNNFSINIPFFTESQHYNTCLNRKVCIDEKGYIKNCLSMDKHYGNIMDKNLKEVVQSQEFQKLWHIKKDDIKVCQDCEFRHMCIDCRAFIKDPKDIYSQPSKCPNNPYIAKWKGEEGYITVEEWQEQQKNITTT